MRRRIIALLILILAFSGTSCRSASGAGADNSAVPDTPANASAFPASPSVSDTLSQTAAVPEDAAWSGEWKRLHTGMFESATLVISNETDNSFEFKIDAFSGSHMGFVDGVAVIDGTSAVFKDKATTAELVFSLNDGLISVTSGGNISYYAGMGVGFDGKYTTKPLPEATLLTQGYVSSESADDAFRLMVGSDYDLFLNTAHMGTEEEELDGFGAIVNRWWVRGLAGYSESVVMLLPDGTFCAGVIDHDGTAIKVYTNAAVITEIPKTIQVWIDKLEQSLYGVPDYTVGFYNTSKN